MTYTKPEITRLGDAAQLICAAESMLKIEGGAFFYTLALAGRGSDLLVRHIDRPPHTFPASHHSLTHLLPLYAA